MGPPTTGADNPEIHEDEPPIIRPAPDVVSRKIDDEVVLVHLRTNRIYSLNATGARLWELLESGANKDRLKQQLLSEFEVPEGQLSAEIDQILASLTAERLVTDDPGV